MKSLNKKILAGLVLGTVIASGALYAKSNSGMNGCQKPAHSFKAKGHAGKMPMFSVLKELNLTQKQKDEIKNIMKEQMSSKDKLSDTFSKNSFDKKLFIKTMKEKQDNKVEQKAIMIEKLYSVLDTKQKVQFKTILELREDRRASRFN